MSNNEHVMEEVRPEPSNERPAPPQEPPSTSREQSTTSQGTSTEGTGNTAKPRTTSIPDDVSNTMLQQAITALINSNRVTQENIRLVHEKMDAGVTRKRKVYISMPEKFDGRIGEYIESWIERFEIWFRYRERYDAGVDQRERIETAIQDTERDVCLDLTDREKECGQWATWDEFATYMKETYGSGESGFTRFVALHAVTQGRTDSVNAYYSRFRRILNRTLEPKSTSQPIHIYMFVLGLKPTIAAEFRRYPESVRMQELNWQQVRELAKRAENTIRQQDGGPSQQESYAGPIRHKSKRPEKQDESSPHPSTRTSVPLTDREKAFLKHNIDRGGGLVIKRETQFKSKWQEWARTEGRCSRCAAKGHGWKKCPAGKFKNKEGKAEPIKGATSHLNAMSDQEDSEQCNEMESDVSSCSEAKETETKAQSPEESESHDVEYLHSIRERKDRLMTYPCEIDKCQGTALADSGATRNYISKDYATRSNLRIINSERARKVKTSKRRYYADTR